MSKTHPFNISKTDDGTFQILGEDFAVYEEKFNAFGREGGAYDWQEVAERVIADQAPNLEQKITFDSEASLFCAISDTRKPLLALAKLLNTVFSDKRRLKRAVRLADEHESEDVSTPSEFDFIVLIHFSFYLYDDFQVIETLLKSGLQPKHKYIRGPRGAGESNLYYRSGDVQAFLDQAKPILKKAGYLSKAVVAFRTNDESGYNVVHPRKRKKKLHPICELD